MPAEWDAATYDRIADPVHRWGLSTIGRLRVERGVVLDAGCGSKPPGSRTSRYGSRREHVAPLSQAERDTFLARTIEELGDLTIDYVRLNMTAIRGSD